MKLGNNKILLGVCDGLAEYCGMDATTMRLLWSIACVFTRGVFVLAYVLMALIMEDPNKNK